MPNVMQPSIVIRSFTPVRPATTSRPSNLSRVEPLRSVDRGRFHGPIAKDVRDRALWFEPTIIQRRVKSPVFARILPVNGAARTPFLGARVILLLTDLHHRSGPTPNALARLFGLTPAQAKFALVIGSGVSLDRAAEELGIARETARNHLKAVFSKTGTHRQGELVALLSKLTV